jgi:hypothetical protein
MPGAIRGWHKGVQLRWRWGGWGRCIAVGIVTGLMLVLMVVSLVAPVPFTWLVSLPSLYGVVLSPFLVPVLVGLATWLCVELPPEWVLARRPRKTVAVVAAVAILVLVLLVWGLVRLDSRWSPTGVRFFRWTVFVLGIESAILIPIWLTWGFIRRRRNKLPWGPLAGANLPAAALAWLVAAAATLGALGLNYRNDLAHEIAFADAATYPVADRLGPGWFDRYLSMAQATVQSIGR